MATIEIYESAVTKKERFYCVHCGFDMTIKQVCVDCNEYKSAVTLDEYYQFWGHYPKPRRIK
jgi:hypothetical protein